MKTIKDMLTSSRNFSATSRRASLGHSLNQSMVVQLTKAGYIRIRFLEGREVRRQQGILPYKGILKDRLPLYTYIHTTSSSHLIGCVRDYNQICF